MSADRRPQPISTAEWMVAFLGLALVVGTLAVLLTDAMRDGRRAPALDVRADSVITAGGRTHVHFTVRNDGRETAAEVVVAGERGRGDARETSRASLAHVPGGSERRGALTFRAVPTLDDVRLWTESWREP